MTVPDRAEVAAPALATPAGGVGRRLLSAPRLKKLASFASTQAFVQALGFVSGVVIVRAMDQGEYGLYTLALTMVGLASVLLDLGLSTAVVALGGPHVQDRSRLRSILDDARRLQVRLALLAVLLLPVFLWMLASPGIEAQETATVLGLVFACAGVQIVNTMALAVVRLRGDIVLQQLLELGTNLVKLSIVIAAASWFLDAQVALAINLFCASLIGLIVWRHLRADVGPSQAPTGEHTRALSGIVKRHAPNALYYCISGQLAVWLVTWFGNADRVAEVGALGRLAMIFALIGSVMTVLVQPFFARATTRDRLVQAFWSLNLFFLLLTAVLVSAAIVAPGALLWILGPKYGGLHVELVWMVLASSLAAWGAAGYSVGAARGWIVPGVVASPAGALALLVSALAFDLSTVAGSFMMNSAAAGVVALVSLVYVWRQLHRVSLVAPDPVSLSTAASSASRT